MRPLRREDTANDSASSMEHYREGYFYHFTDKAGNIYSAPLQNCRVLLLLLWQRRGAAGNGLGTMIN
jgi:hypothetical protein